MTSSTAMMPDAGVPVPTEVTRDKGKIGRPAYAVFFMNLNSKN
jgi:hypothetical protein